MVERAEFEILNRELYAYTAILRQLLAKHNNTELAAQINILLLLYDEVTAPDFHTEDINLVHSKLDQLRVCVMNLHVLTANHKLVELQPICVYLGDLIHKVKQALGEEDPM